MPSLTGVGLVIFGAAVVLMSSGIAWADWVSVQAGYVQREWVPSQSIEAAALAVRPDNQLIVATARCPMNCSGNDGFLHLVAPYGHAVTSGNRFGPPKDLTAVRLRGKELFAWSASEIRGCGSQPCSHPLYRLDASSGKTLGIEGWWSTAGPAYALDPLTNKFAILIPQVNHAATYGWDTRVELYDPDHHRSSTLMMVPNCDPNGFTFGSDGKTVFFDCSGYTIDAFDRSGNRLYQITTAPPQCCVPGSGPNSFVFGPRGGLFANRLVFLDEFADVFIVTPAAGATPRQLTTGNPAAAPASFYATAFDDKGDLVASLGNNVMCLGVCPDLPPPPSGGSGSGGPPRGSSGSSGGSSGDALGGVGSHGGLPALVQPAGPGSAPATSGSLQNASQAASQSSVQAASQGGTAPNAVGLADAPDDDPALSFPAAGFGAHWSVVVRLVGAAATALMALAALALSSPSRRLRPASNDRRTFAGGERR